TGEKVWWELDFQIRPDQARRGAELDLRSDTWNPSLVQKGVPRDENLGLMLQTLELRQHGETMALREALPIPSPPARRYGLWLWYQGTSSSDTPIPHLFDLWQWYALAAGLPRRVIALLLVLIGVPSLLCVMVGLRYTWAALRRVVVHEPIGIEGGHGEV
ncbi:MAG: hypothetical protein M1358_18705, partial [Chloroflexi bacterium]|nr:hypothetical protein [Chloroflexota bacterium]